MDEFEYLYEEILSDDDIDFLGSLSPYGESYDGKIKRPTPKVGDLENLVALQQFEQSLRMDKFLEDELLNLFDDQGWV